MNKKSVTPAQVMEIKKMADEKGIDRETFNRLFEDFSRVLDVAKVPMIIAIEAGQTELWLHPDQTATNCVEGWDIYDHLYQTGKLDGCADTADLVAVQFKGIEFFRRHFAGKSLVAWKSADLGQVAYLAECRGALSLNFGLLRRNLNSDCPALRIR